MSRKFIERKGVVTYFKAFSYNSRSGMKNK